MKPEGGYNLMGVCSPVIDELVHQVVSAPDRAHLVAAAHALDRVLLAGWYVVPHWYLQSVRVAYWDRFGRPDKPVRTGARVRQLVDGPGESRRQRRRQAQRAMMSARSTPAAGSVPGRRLMGAYLLRRLLLVIPTLFGIIAINFVVVQFAPGGPVEQMIAELKGQRRQRHRPHDRRRRERRRCRPATAAIAAPAGSIRM